MTDIVLDQYAPGGVMKQLGDAAGGIVYNQYAPGGCYGQLYTASGMTDPPSQYAPGGPYGQIEQELEGGGAPAWVPANAVIHIDLVGGSPQGRAWVAGTGEVAVDALLGTDANAIDGLGTTQYNPACLKPNGYSVLSGQGSANIALIGAARTKALAGSTFRLQMKDGDQSSGTSFGLTGTSASAGIQVDLKTTRALAIYSWGGAGTTGSVANYGSVFSANVSYNVIAGTLVPIRVDYTANGNVAQSIVLTETDFPISGDDTLDIAFITLSTGGVGTNYRQFLQSITLYDPLPSTAGLSDLSEVT